MNGLAWLIFAFLVAWLLLQRAGLRELRRQVEGTRRDMYRAQYEAQEALQRVEHELRLLRLEERARAGELKVGPSATVAETLQMHANMAGVLAQFHITGAGAQDETLAQAARTYAQDVEAILTAVHTTLAQPAIKPDPDTFAV